MRSVPTYIAGVNSKDVFDLNQPDPGGKGGFGAAYFAPDQPSSRSDQWNLTIEKEVLGNTVVRAALIGQYATKLDQFYDYNEEMPNYIWFVKTGLRLPTGENAAVARRQWSTPPMAAS